ncbi:MAG: outer membrane lipoprotein LolB [Gammaproteobacteria bacterium]|nr:outer membrane lipoprotein LolB [Gammaproteobacteria bacterium]
MTRLPVLPALFLVLSGCVTTPENAEPVSDESHELWYQRQQQLSTVQNWEIRGRVALFVDDKVYNLGLDWRLDKDLSSLKLEAPLGQGLIQLEKKDSQVTLLTSEGKTYNGQNAEQVLYQSTGWSIPVEGLRSWIKGINHNQSDYLPDIDSTGKAVSMHQDDWRISFLQYKKSQLANNYTSVLPRKIYMKRDNLALKIVIDQWQAQQKTPSSELFPTFED